MISGLLSHFACSSGYFLGFPTWYHYLPKASGTCNPSLDHLSYIWLIVAALVEVLVRIAAIVAFAFVIYGSITYITSQGESNATAKAKDTIINSLIGLAISVTAAGAIAFIAGSVK